MHSGSCDPRAFRRGPTKDRRDVGDRASSEEAEGGVMSTARLRVLIIDHEPPIRKLLCMGIQGYEFGMEELLAQMRAATRHQLRQKIETNPERPQCILPETGIGYRLRAPD